MRNLIAGVTTRRRAGRQTARPQSAPPARVAIAVQCAWCRRVELPEGATDDGRYTHTICPACTVRYFPGTHAAEAAADIVAALQPAGVLA